MNLQEDIEGFICPNCMVELASSSQLQDHWIRFHNSNASKTNETNEQRLWQFPGQVTIDYEYHSKEMTEKQKIKPITTGGMCNSQTIKGKMFHVFERSNILQPIICEFCGGIIWSEARQCHACGFKCHRDCEPLIVTLCSSWSGTTADIKKDPVQEMPSTSNVASVPSPKGFKSQIRHQISRGKLRHVDETFDLDLTYITDRIIAMSFPASGLESTYRNSLIDVAMMLQQKHGNNYMVFNVSERRYDISKLNNQVLDFGWPDHLAPPLERLISIIKSIDSWLSADDHNVAVVHCKGGKGRTGVVVAAYIQFNKICPSPQAALDWFALRRFYDAKFGGVTQPSQKRYVHYFGDFLENKLTIQKRSLLLNHIIIHGMPNFDGKGGCRPFVKIYQGYQLIHTSQVYASNCQSDSICLNFQALTIAGDIMVKCYQKGNIPTLQDTIFRCQFNTDAIIEHRLVLRKKDLDEAYKDRRFPDNSSVELIFKQANASNTRISQDEHISAAFKSLTSNSESTTGRFIETPIQDFSTCSVPSKDEWVKGLQACHMESEAECDTSIKSLQVPKHIPGPINGNPYALVDRPLFKQANKDCKSDTEMQNSAPNIKSFDLSKGINDLDNLLTDLGFLTSCKPTNLSSTLIKRDENDNISYIEKSNVPTTVTTKLPTINVVGMETAKTSAPVCFKDDTSNHGNENGKPRLPARTSSFGAVNRHHHHHHKGSVGRSVSEDGGSCSDSSMNHHLKIHHSQSVGSDDVFRQDGPLSPTVSEMLNELSNSPLSTESHYNNWQNKRTRNFTTKYDNVNEQSSISDKSSEGEFYQGRVRDHVKQFNRILSSPDPSKVGTGVPMPGLVQGIDYEEKISKFNYRSLAPGQRGAIPDRLYMAGSPPKRIVYEVEEENDSKDVETDGLFIPCYADQPTAYYLRQHENAKKQGMKLSNGNINPDSMIQDDHQMIDNSCEIIHHDQHREARANSDSAYEESIRSSSVASTSFASNAQQKCSKNEYSKSSGRGSPPSSVTSLDDEDSSGYARIEDIQLMKEKIKKSNSPVIIEPKDEEMQEQEVIAVSHSMQEQTLPNRLNKQIPEIKSKKDLSLAVYQTNYLPGLTNGQPTVLSSSQIDLEDESFQNDSTQSSVATSPSQEDRSHLTLESNALSKKTPSENNFGSGVHIVESPPSPCCSSKSDSSCVTPSPTRKTLRHRLRRSNSSTSSVSSSELFPDVLRYPHVKFDKDTLKFWYKPKITRDEAIALLKDKAPGAFVVRDSQSYEGAFGLAVKVATPPLGVIQQAGGDLSKINMENELIRHFLIEPCKQGVRLKGSNNEPAFPSLVALVFQHSVTKMALPIELKLPTQDIENYDELDGAPLTEQQVLQKGAACNLVYLSCIEVEGLTGDGAVKYAIGKTLSTNHNIKSTIITIKVNQDGITLTDEERRLFFRKHFSIKDVLHCVVDPRGRRFNLRDVIPEIPREAPCFGIVVCKPQRPLEHECIVFAEMEPSQPASAVIDFIQRAMKAVKK